MTSLHHVFLEAEPDPMRGDGLFVLFLIMTGLLLIDMILWVWIGRFDGGMT